MRKQQLGFPKLDNSYEVISCDYRCPASVGPILGNEKSTTSISNTIFTCSYACCSCAILPLHPGLALTQKCVPNNPLYMYAIQMFDQLFSEIQVS